MDYQQLIEMLQEFESEVRGEKTQLKNGKLPIPHFIKRF